MAASNLTGVADQTFKPSLDDILTRLRASARTPIGNGMLGWTGIPEDNVSNNRPTAGEVYMQRLEVEQTGTCNNLWMVVTSSGASMTAGQNFVGLLDENGNRLSTSADTSAIWTSTGVKTVAMLTPPLLTAGQVVYSCFVMNGTTIPQLAGKGQGLWYMANLGPLIAGNNWVNPTPPYTLAPNHFKAMSFSSGLTSIPATIDLFQGNPDQVFFVGLSN